MPVSRMESKSNGPSWTGLEAREDGINDQLAD